MHRLKSKSFYFVFFEKMYFFFFKCLNTKHLTLEHNSTLALKIKWGKKKPKNPPFTILKMSVAWNVIAKDQLLLALIMLSRKSRTFCIILKCKKIFKDVTCHNQACILYTILYCLD